MTKSRDRNSVNVRQVNLVNKKHTVMADEQFRERWKEYFKELLNEERKGTTRHHKCSDDAPPKNPKTMTKVTTEEARGTPMRMKAKKLRDQMSCQWMLGNL